MCKNCNDGEFLCEDFDWNDDEDYGESSSEYTNDEESLSKKAEELSLDRLEQLIVEKETMARDQYGYKIPYYGYPKTYADKIRILEQRLNALIDFLKAKGVIDKAYVQKDAKETVLDSIREELGKQEWSKHVSKEYFEEQVRLEGIRRSLKTPHRSMVIEKTILSESSIVEDIDRGYREHIDPIDNVRLDPLMTWAEYLTYMGHQHPDIMEKYYFLIQSLEPQRVKGSSALEKLSKEEDAVINSRRPTDIPKATWDTLSPQERKKILKKRLAL